MTVALATVLALAAVILGALLAAEPPRERKAALSSYFHRPQHKPVRRRVHTPRHLQIGA